jgi:hypothetical protein
MAKRFLDPACSRNLFNCATFSQCAPGDLKCTSMPPEPFVETISYPELGIRGVVGVAILGVGGLMSDYVPQNS